MPKNFCANPKCNNAIKKSEGDLCLVCKRRILIQLTKPKTEQLKKDIKQAEKEYQEGKCKTLEEVYKKNGK